MRIERIGSESNGDRRRIAAEVTWEDCARPSQQVYFETTVEFTRGFDPSPDAFLLPCLPIAVWQGERRILVEGSVCPRLRDGLEAATGLFRQWYDHCRPVKIEPTRGFVPTVPRTGRRAASFMSGGIDALALLRANRLNYPLHHPSSFRDCLLLFGLNSFDFDAAGPRPERLTAFESQVRKLSQLAELAHFTLIPVYTNTRTLYPDFHTWSSVGAISGIICPALAARRRISEAWHGSDGCGMSPRRPASDPRLPPHFSTAAVEVHVGQPVVTRFMKTRIVADWDEALPFLRSCFGREISRDGPVNCGRCEKCIRTMLAFVALGKLDRATTFPHSDVTPEMLEIVDIKSIEQVEYYSQCLGPLERSHRDDLARPLRAKLESYYRLERWKRKFGRLDRWDRRFLRGRLARWYCRMSGSLAGGAEDI